MLGGSHRMRAGAAMVAWNAAGLAIGVHNARLRSLIIDSGGPRFVSRPGRAAIRPQETERIKMNIGQIEGFVERAVTANMPVLLIGPPGCGKTVAGAAGVVKAGRRPLTLDWAIG